MTFFFWLFLSLIFYTYIGYPVALYFWSRKAARPVNKGSGEPSVSVIIAAWNEEDAIRRRIDNLLSLDYPADKIEILIGSDGSTDHTVAIAESFHDPRLKPVSFYKRRGKVSVLNDLVAQAQNEILFFADCRQTFETHVIRELVGNFSDPFVGCVSGELVLSEGEGGAGKGIGLYWKYEKFMRACESRIHSMLGATGAIYAIRRELFVKIPQRIVLDDMYVPLGVIRQGFRAVYDDAAKAHDQVADDPGEEMKRKVRTLYGNYQIFGEFSDLFIPVKSPLALQFFSHKVLRVWAPVFLIAVFLLNMALADQGEIYSWLMILQVLFYGMAFAGGIFRDAKEGGAKMMKSLCYVPYVFCLLNFSAFIGLIRFILHDQSVMWDKARKK